MNPSSGRGLKPNLSHQTGLAHFPSRLRAIIKERSANQVTKPSSVASPASNRNKFISNPIGSILERGVVEPSSTGTPSQGSLQASQVVAADSSATRQAIKTRATMSEQELKVRPLLSTYEGEESDELRGWEWFHLTRRARGEYRFELGQHESGVNSVAVTPRGDRVASGDMSGLVRVWNLAGRTIIHEQFRKDPFFCKNSWLRSVLLIAAPPKKGDR